MWSKLRPRTRDNLVHTGTQQLKAASSCARPHILLSGISLTKDQREPISPL
jgi:hypothetical protein